MESGPIGTIVIPAHLVGLSDARWGDRTTILHIRETVTDLRIDRIEAVLYAYLDGEMVAALDFTKTDDDVRVNTVFVKLQFRRRGIGSALARYLAAQHPGAQIKCPRESDHNSVL